MTITITEFVIPAGFLGYVGRSQLDWKVGTEPARADWDGPYVAPDADQATGYVEADMATQRGHGSIWTVKSPLPIKAVLVRGDSANTPAISAAVHGWLKRPGFILEELGRDERAYVGPAPEGAFELAMSRALFHRLNITAERLADARFRATDRPNWCVNLPDAPWLVLANVSAAA